MKKVLVCFSFIALTVTMFIGCFPNDKNSMEGIYLKGKEGNSIIIDKDDMPIVMRNETGKEDVFEGLKSGDKIEITYDSIAESYPAQTQIYSCELIEKGDLNNIPQDILSDL